MEGRLGCRDSRERGRPETAGLRRGMPGTAGLRWESPEAAGLRWGVPGNAGLRWGIPENAWLRFEVPEVTGVGRGVPEGAGMRGGGGGNSDQFGLGCFGLTAPLAALATPLGLRSLVGKTGTAMSGVSLSYPPLQVDHLTGVVHYNGRR